jgi:hypothetical protein
VQAAARSTVTGTHERRARAAAAARRLLAGLSLLAAARLHQLRRAGRADRDHASRAGRGATLDLGGPFPACAQLLHAAARPRGAAAGDLHRLADAPHLGRHRCRRAVRAAVARAADRAVVGLPALRRRAGGGRRALRHQARSHRAGAGGGMAHRRPGAASPAAVGHRGRSIHCDLRFQCTVSADRAGSGDRRLARRACSREPRWRHCSAGAAR